MNEAPEVLIAEPRVPRSRPAPRLRLLTELEPRHRVFFDNLADLLLSRRVPQARISSRPAAFWNDVFVPSGISWISFLESMIWHVLLITLFVWGQSRVWEPVKLFPPREVFHRPITYYPPTHSFPASQSRASNVRPLPRVRRTPTQPPAHQAAMPVTPEQKPRMVTPPDIKQATARLPNLPGSHTVTPMVPLSATAESQRRGLAGPSVVVAPPPQVDQVIDKATARQLALPPASAIAPAPEVAGGSAGRAMKAPNNLQVVPPPPSVQSAGRSAKDGRLSSLSGGPNVVPAPPSVQRGGDAAGDPRLRSMGAGSQVVPPPPSVHASNSSGNGRLNTLSSARPNVVLPPPSVQGGAAASARLGAMGSAGSQVIPPPPSVQSAGGARLGSLAGAGSEVVAPPPSVEGSGNAGRGGRLASLSGDGAPVAPTHSSVAGNSVAGNSAGGSTGKVLEPMDPLPGDAASSAVSSAMTAGNENQSSVEELPLGFLGVVFAAPGTSFFSNFEVFVAKRRVGGNLQLIKLVYEFLPYQRRLSEYDLNNLPPRVIKLRVTPDPSCDEALGHIIQPSTDLTTRTAAEYPKIPAALRSFDPNAVLPCYRTTAADFQKAMSQGR